MNKKNNSWLEFKAHDMGFITAHLTLHWMGEISNSEKTIISQWLFTNNLHTYTTFVKPIRVSIFGSGNGVPVIEVDIFNDLKEMKSEIEQLIPSASEFPFKPHITLMGIGQELIRIPTIIKLSRLDLKSSKTPF